MSLSFSDRTVLGSSPLPVGAETYPIVVEDSLLSAAVEFLRSFCAEQRKTAAEFDERRIEIEKQIAGTGTYVHSLEELTWGSRVAWRNSARCIGRLYWNSLRIRDMRTVVTTADMFAQCVEHIRVSFNDGVIRPTITIFPQQSPSGRDPEIVSPQLLCYAGYDRPGRRSLGDRQRVGLTEEAIGAGWSPPRRRGRFDVLPLLLRDADGQLEARTYPAGLVPEVRLSHPEHPWFRKLGLRWFGPPVVTDLALYIGGIVYPAVPFSGWFMGTEIGARNLADRARYDQLPVIAEALGLDTSRPDTLWADRAAVELTRAVQHSFTQAGVRMTDHHTESVMFARHIEREERAGRDCPADWSWLVPPISGALTGIFHRYYAFHDTSAPQFFRRTPFTGEGAGCPEQTFA